MDTNNRSEGTATEDQQQVNGNPLLFLRMSKKELTILVQLVRSDTNDEKGMDDLIDQLKEETKDNIEYVAERIKARRLASISHIRQKFPQLTDTELEVCRLVVKGGTLKGIARIMKKSQNNISTVRGNIRKKLGLKTVVDLRDFLTKALE